MFFSKQDCVVFRFHSSRLSPFNNGGTADRKAKKAGIQYLLFSSLMDVVVEEPDDRLHDALHDAFYDACDVYNDDAHLLVQK